MASPSSPFRRSKPLKIQLWDLGERCKLPSGSGRSPAAKRWCIQCTVDMHLSDCLTTNNFLRLFFIKRMFPSGFDLSGGFGGFNPPLVEDDPHTGD